MAQPQDTNIQPQAQPVGQEVAQNPQAQPIQDAPIQDTPIQDGSQPIQDLPAAQDNMGGDNMGGDTAIDPSDDNEAVYFDNHLMIPFWLFQKMLDNPQEYADKYGVDVLKQTFGDIVGKETFADKIANVAAIIDGGAVDGGVQEINPQAQAAVQGDVAQNNAIQDMDQAQSQPDAQSQPAGENLQDIQNIADEEANKSQGQPQGQSQVVQ